MASPEPETFIEEEVQSSNWDSNGFVKGSSPAIMRSLEAPVTPISQPMEHRQASRDSMTPSGQVMLSPWPKVFFGC